MRPYRKEVIGPATLMLGDSAELIAELDGFDAVVTDPPYEFDASGGGAFRNARGTMDVIHATGLSAGFDHNFMTSTLAPNIAVFCHNDQLATLLPHFARAFDRHVLLQWHKTNPVPLANRHYRPDTEFWIHAWMRSAPPVGTLAQKARFFLSSVGKSEFDHPTVKPAGLMAKVIAPIAGDCVLDPFMGTGSTGVAALALGRRFIGIEIEPRYFDIACRRLEAAHRQAAFEFEIGGGA